MIVLFVGETAAEYFDPVDAILERLIPYLFEKSDLCIEGYKPGLFPETIRAQGIHLTVGTNRLN